MIYAKATSNQIDEIMAVYSSAITAMEDSGIHQWNEIYPDKTTIANDICKNQMYVGIIDNKIAVCFALSEDCDEQYKNGKWAYPNSKFCVIHRLCVSPEFQHKGIASQAMSYIEKLCKSVGYNSIRLDCFTLNPYSKRLYDKAGYKVVGYADWRKGRFELREKILQNLAAARQKATSRTDNTAL